MSGSLLAYDAAGNVIATLTRLVVHGPDDRPGLVDFAQHEDENGDNLDVWHVSGAKGSKVWRGERLGTRAHEYRVELVGPPGQKRIVGLVHKATGEDARNARGGPQDAPREVSALPLVNRRR